MKRIESIEDEMRGVVTYEIGGGQLVCFDARMVKEAGIEALMRHEGLKHEMPTERLPVIHHGQRVGTMPPDFDPMFVKSSNWLYDPRHGDFKREGETWVAARNLGPGDLDLVVGFVRDDKR